MSVITQKLSIGVATCAMAAAATLTPIPVAQAAPAPAPLPMGAGSSILQNDYWWFPQNSPRPTRAVPVPFGSSSTHAGGPILVFTPINLVPGFLQPFYGWLTQDLNFKVCIPGASVKIGAYGTITLAVGRASHGCNQ